jgi:cation:H+ antiporter
VVLERDFPVMAGFTLALTLMAWSRDKPGSINRLEGSLLLASYLAYQTLLYFSARS